MSHLSVAFVNNMPDTAFAATERQFLGLVASEVGPLSIDVSKYSMTGIPHGEAVAQIIAKGYLPIDSLWEQQPDALIVTGSEPLTTSLSDEAYWGQLTHLLQSFVGRAGSILLSCLSAHAALRNS